MLLLSPNFYMWFYKLPSFNLISFWHWNEKFWKVAERCLLRQTISGERPPWINISPQDFIIVIPTNDGVAARMEKTILLRCAGSSGNMADKLCLISNTPWDPVLGPGPVKYLQKVTVKIYHHISKLDQVNSANIWLMFWSLLWSFLQETRRVKRGRKGR